MLGCAVCVYDLYEEALAAYEDSGDTCVLPSQTAWSPDYQGNLHANLRIRDNGMFSHNLPCDISHIVSSGTAGNHSETYKREACLDYCQYHQTTPSQELFSKGFSMPVRLHQTMTRVLW